jgi:hypothetical protein
MTADFQFLSPERPILATSPSEAWVYSHYLAVIEGFESRIAHGYLCNANIVYYLVELSSTDRSLVTRSPTEYLFVYLSLNDISYNNNSFIYKY